MKGFGRKLVFGGSVEKFGVVDGLGWEEGFEDMLLFGGVDDAEG